MGSYGLGKGRPGLCPPSAVSTTRSSHQLNLQPDAADRKCLLRQEVASFRQSAQVRADCSQPPMHSCKRKNRHAAAATLITAGTDAGLVKSMSTRSHLRYAAGALRSPESPRGLLNPSEAHALITSSDSQLPKQIAHSEGYCLPSSKHMPRKVNGQFQQRKVGGTTRTGGSERERQREKEHERERETERQTERERETEKETQRHRDTETQRHRDTETQRHRDTETETDRERQSMTETDRDRERQRETERDTERHGETRRDTETERLPNGH